ncbi:MAG TPA: ATP-binding cassette domain-containing protein, partial [Thermoanaerobaculia bacterium]|nr:ATP-binding cassette domain-containing protein [Thermoanaerobaculia bacterium]
MRLVAERLVRSFGPRRIFGPLSFEVAAGRVLGVAGANGAGKTTLLRVLAGLLRPTTGHVTLEGLDGSPAAEPRGVPWAIGWAGPDLALYGDLTAAENLDFFAEAAGTPHGKAEAAQRLVAVGLDPSRLSALPSRMLSTGQRQRLKLAYATLAAAPLLLLDEPGSNLDEPGRAIVMKVVAAQRL